jgi:hypothetical protein
MDTTTRNATLTDLAVMLREQHARKLDMVVPASQIRSEEGVLVVAGAEAQIDLDGVTVADGEYRPTVICDEGIADKLGVPVAYLKRMRESRPDLYDANVNGWLHGYEGRVENLVVTGEDAVEADTRSFLLRCFRGDVGKQGIARAFLSNGYKVIDHLDVLTATLDGIRESGTPVDIIGCDLTDRKMYVRVAAPEIAVLAPTLLAGYRSPAFEHGRGRDAWSSIDRIREVAAREGKGYEPGKEPVVFAGFEISNSETGGGASTITPRLIVEICRNGLKIQQDILRAVHLGSKMDDGIVRWSDDTQRKQLQLITAQARDAVATFLDVEYVKTAVGRLEAKAGTPVRHAAETVETVCKTLRFSEEHTAGVLDHFIQGGQMTAGGVMQAVTSFAQTIMDADDAAAFEAQGVRALELAAQS